MQSFSNSTASSLGEVPNSVNNSVGPAFLNTMSYDEFLRSFLAFVRRFPDCAFALEKPTRPLPLWTRRKRESESDFKERRKEGKEEITKWKNGSAMIYSHLFFAVSSTNPRAANIIAQPEISSCGIRALEQLGKDYKDDSSNNNGRNLLLGEFAIRAIHENETISQFIDALEAIRLRLINLKHFITDNEMLIKIMNGMTSLQNQRYLPIKHTLTVHSITELSELVRVLRNIDIAGIPTATNYQQIIPSNLMHTIVPTQQTTTIGGMQSTPNTSSQFPSTVNANPIPQEANMVGHQTQQSTSCFRCGIPGHYARDCRKGRFNNKRQPNQHHHRKIFKSHYHGKKNNYNTNHNSNRNKRYNNNRHHKNEDHGARFGGMVTNENTDSEIPSNDFAILDSGCTNHLTPRRDILSEFEVSASSITIADDTSMSVKGKGNYHILKDILYCPKAKHTLISISTLCDNGYDIRLNKDQAVISIKGIPILYATKRNRLYYVKLSDLIPNQALMATSGAPISNLLIHARLGHPSERLMMKIKSENLATGININSKESIPDCKSCILSKAHRRGNRKELRDSLPSRLKKSIAFGQLLHIDSSGPFSVPAIPDNETHILVIIDAYSGYIFDFYNSNINTNFVTNCLRETFAFIQANNGHLSHYHSDGALSLIGKEIRDFLMDHNMTFSFNCPYSPEDNSFAERSFRTIKEKASALLQYSSLPTPFWKYACRTAVYLMNRLPRGNSQGVFQSPFQTVFGEVPDLSHLRIFGTQAVAYLDKPTRSNDWSRKGIHGIFIGYRPYGLGYLLYLPSVNQIKESGNMFFLEKNMIERESSESCQELVLVNNAPRRNLEDYQNLIGLLHQDPEDKLIYITSRIRKLKGYLVAYRKLYQPDGLTNEINDPIHVEDVAQYTETFYQKSLINILRSTPTMVNGEEHDEVRKKPKNAVTTGDRGEIAGTQQRKNERIAAFPRQERERARTRGREDERVVVLRQGAQDPGRKRGREVSKEVPISIFKDQIKDIASDFVRKSRKNMINLENLNQIHQACNFCEIQKDQPTIIYNLCNMNDCWISEYNSREEPKLSFQKVMNSPDHDKWMEAMSKEIASLEAKGCWEVVPTPRRYNLVRSFFIYKIKKNKYGVPIKYKARLVAKGDTQIFGVDFWETYSPVARLATLRTLLGVSAIEKMLIHQIDVNSAYINADLTEIIYMSPPPNYKIPGNHILRLKKSIYGLKQAGLNWYRCISEFLISIGFHVCSSDNCTFVKDKETTDIVIIIVYVDDILISARELQLINLTKDLIKRRFQIEDFGEINYYLGIAINRDITSGAYYMNQRGYIESLCDKFNIKTNPSCNIPLPYQFQYNVNEYESLTEDEKNYVLNFPTRQLIGAINYIALCTRPDISYAISLLARYQDKPNLSTCKATVYLLKFLLNTKHYEIKFTGSTVSLVAYSDSDWAGDRDSRKSTTGYILYLGNAPITWQSKLQPLVALSSTEAEYLALSTTAQENICIKFLLRDWGYKIMMPTTIYCDNQGAIQLTINHAQHKRTRHIEIKYHYVRDLESTGQIVISKMHTTNMIADLLTKIVSKKVYDNLIQQLLGWGAIYPCEERLEVYQRLIENK